jgi:Ni/Fe-hydrogenase subunit HybB-like protein
MTVRTIKMILWALVGAALVALIARFAGGLGVTTNLSDMTPWGLWIGLKLAGVAFAAGGFTIAAVVYVFQLESYHLLARRSVLIGFLGYTFFVISLIVDLGIPWNIWRPIAFWNLHSPLFEVAWCVMLYLTVLALEFAPVVLEKYRQRWALCDLGFRFLRRVTIPLVIFGIALSVLHQSSLGTLFAIMPHRQHPLFYSPIINVQFFVSCVAMGLAAVIVESYLAYSLYRRRINDHQLQSLGRFLAWVIWLFIAIRLGDLALRGDARYLVDSGWNGVLFWIEMALLLLAPSLLLQWRRVRESRVLLATMAFTVVTGFIINRVSIAGLATISPTGTTYFPSFLEILMSLGLVPGVAVLIWMFLVEHYEVWQHEDALDDVDTRFEPPQIDRPSGVWIGDSGLASFKLYSLGFVVAAALTFGLLPRDALFGASPVAEPVERPRGHDVLMIDGNRNGVSVRFDHRKHEEKLGLEKSCNQCHHLANPMDQDTPCWCCHRDMWSITDIFDHDGHVRDLERFGADDACAACHPGGGRPKARETASSCTVEGCHQHELALHREDTRVQPKDVTRTRFAVGYMDAMHKLCIECHKERAAELGRPHHGDCATCHHDAPGSEAVILAHLKQRHELSLRKGGTRDD